MAAPTDVRVEAESLTTTRLRWTYPGTAVVFVYRSTNGSSYTAAATGVAPGTTEYEDTGLTAATKYWYKLSDDTGSTFSSVVTVYTHACGTDPNGRGVEIVLPRETEDQVSAETFNALATVVEQGLVKFVAPDGRTCVACISDGALVIDCVDFDGCDVVEVAVDQDINSISLPNCADGDVSIEFIVPPNVTRKIGGWPRGIGFTGDEGFRAPVAGGSSGRSINEDIRRGFNLNTRSGKSKSGNETGGTNQGGASSTFGSCTCTPTADGGMRIVTCSRAGAPATNNSLGCANSTKGAVLLVCGGRGPYTWSSTGNVTKSATTGSSITVTPPTNTGTAVGGLAYREDFLDCTFCTAGVCTTCGPASSVLYDCNDVPVGGTTTSSCATPPNPTCPNVPVIASLCDGFGNHTPGVTIVRGAQTFTIHNPYSVVSCDERTPAMIALGCNPCGTVAGATVTVTDSLGTQVTIVMGV